MKCSVNGRASMIGMLDIGRALAFEENERKFDAASVRGRCVLLNRSETERETATYLMEMRTSVGKRTRR